MKTKLKSTNAITLIALIITIIVMLILVGVVVSVVINSNLLGTAKTAVDNTKTAYEDEANWGDQIGGTQAELANKYLNGSGKKTLVSQIKPENYGDTVSNYTANGVSDWKIFLNDGTNVYLISSGYVEVENGTAGLTTDGLCSYWEESWLEETTRLY